MRFRTLALASLSEPYFAGCVLDSLSTVESLKLDYRIQTRRIWIGGCENPADV